MLGKTIGASAVSVKYQQQRNFICGIRSRRKDQGVTFNAVNLVGHSLWQNVVAGGVILAAVIVDRLFERRAR